MAVTAHVTRRIPAGWYPDRDDRSRRRWFDGTEWTDYYSAAPRPTLELVPDLESDPEFKYTLDLPFESTMAAPVTPILAPQPRPEDEVVVEYEEPATPTTKVTLRSAITFHDRIPAFVISGLIVGDAVAVGFFAHLL